METNVGRGDRASGGMRGNPPGPPGGVMTPEELRGFLEGFVVKLVDPCDGSVSTGFFVNREEGFLLTCWHVIEPEFAGEKHGWMWAEFGGRRCQAKFREDLSNRNADIAVLQVDPGKLQYGFKVAPLRLSWRFSGRPSQVEADPVAALGFETLAVTPHRRVFDSALA